MPPQIIWIGAFFTWVLASPVLDAYVLLLGYIWQAYRHPTYQVVDPHWGVYRGVDNLED